jgi:hypothetical protein
MAMSLHRHDAPATPAGVVAELVQRLRGLGEVLWSAQSDDTLVSVVEGLQVLVAAAAAVEAGVLVEAEARDLAKGKLAFGSTGDWLTHVGGLRQGEGKKRLARAQALTGPLDRTRRGLLEGRVSPAQADLIVAAVQALPSGEWVPARGERLMVESAARLDATDLARTGRHLVQVVDPDAEDRRHEAALERAERAAHLSRYLVIADDGAGGIRLKGYGSVEDGAVLRAALLPMTAPRPAGDLDVAGEPCEQATDSREHGARLWDALVATAQHALDTDLPPETHGARPRLIVTLDHDTLKRELEGRGVATTADGLDLPPAVVRRLACDAGLIPAVLGGRGEVLDVGRTRRLVTAVLWTALVLRDRHCTFPGCTRPPLMCHAHHITHWLNGGRTSQSNLPSYVGTTTGPSTTRHGRSDSILPTTNPNSSHQQRPAWQPNGSDIDPEKNRVSVYRPSCDRRSNQTSWLPSYGACSARIAAYARSRLASASATTSSG